uniref:Sulfatase N-terminal domain-containing protein n=1 Tax=Panagrolaimus sp. ES5 TaxID=591445 RepID=A0AC34FKE5_9BILA
MSYGRWIKVINGTKPECDVIEVECKSFKNNEVEIFYQYLHAQIYRNTTKIPLPSLPKPPEKYDVHIIILDSVGRTQFIRSMPKTLQILRGEYEAVPFRHLNKIGLNSRPNGNALLLGKALKPIPKSPFSRGYPSDFPNDNCKTYLDNEQFIGFRYQDDGYVTMMAEDWSRGVFTYPNCHGFQKTPMDHYMKPFQRICKRSKTINKIIHLDSCREPHHDIMDYLKNFVKAYPDKPKFSLSWMSRLTHDQQNALSSSDDYFYRFFKYNQKDFENSFVFFMGDHGLRYGKVREKLIGEIEDNNPFLYISAPKLLRNNPKLMLQLKDNSKELITHYDIYATLNEIAQPKNPRIVEPLLHGASLFHPLPYPRTCDSLRIPFEYCICRAQKTLLPKNNTIGIAAAKIMIDQINFELSTSNETSNICSKLSLDESAEIKVEDYGGEQALRINKITFSTIPGNALFWGVISYDPSNENIEIISSKFPRLNSYGRQAKCAKKSSLASYCYCFNESVLKFL